MVPVGERGELCTRGYSVMLGYWDNDEATRAAIDAARWMHTGDLATMDDEGYLNIVGRIKDMIIRGGENVYPREIEEFLYSHPKVQDVQVIGVPDEKYGEEIMAWVKLREGQAATAEEIRDYCRGKIAHYKIPRYVRFVDALPHDGDGQGAEVPDARGERGGARPGEGRRRQDGLTTRRPAAGLRAPERAFSTAARTELRGRSPT